MRAFIGVDFNEELKGAIGVLQNKLREHAIRGRWKYVGNFHLTLKFFDEISDRDIDKIDEVMRRACEGSEGFRLAISEMGIFNGRDSIRVLWLGLGGDMDLLRGLHTDMDDSLESIGFEKEKRVFKPHVTIGQDLVFGGSFENIKKIGEEDIRRMKEIRVDSLYLFKSEQIGAKRVYTKIREYPLGKK